MEIKRINLDVSSVCNAKCEFCTHTKENLPPKHLDLNLFENLDWQSIPELDTIILCGIAGEPTAHPDFLRLVKFIKSLDKHIILITNGTFRYPLWWMILCDLLDSDDEIIFGLDGTTKETHEMYRGTDFDSLIMNIKVVTGVRKTISYIVFLHNENQISDARKLSKELGCDIMFRKSSEYNDRFKVPTVRPPLDKRQWSVRGCYADIGEASIDLDGGIHYCCYSYVNFITGRANTLKYWKTFGDFKKGSQLYDEYRKKMQICNDCFPHRPLEYTDIMNIDLGLTSRCNLKCKLCQRTFRNFQKTLPAGWNNKDIDFEILKREFTPAFLKQLKSMSVCGSLGDPLLYKNFNDFVFLMYKHGRHIRANIHTNGTMYDRSFWRNLGNRFKETKTIMQFAIDGVDAETYSKYRDGDYKKLMDNIEAYSETGAQLAFQFIIFKHNEHQINDMRKLAKEFGATVRYQISYYYDDILERPDFYERDIGKPVCRSIEQKQISIDQNCIVTPCCHSRLFKLKDDIRPDFIRDKQELDLHTSTIKRAIKTEFFNKLWLRNKEISICKSSCFQNRRFGVNKIS